MCGVVGVVNLDGAPVPSRLLRRMTDAVAHRGPDGEGRWIDGPVGLGHRRLAIIDLTSVGNQPMATADGRYVLSYNGEIYNFRELRAELEAKGHRFRSRTDTEVLLLALAEWGISALHRLNGMFAFALWDRKERRLTLARDRYGIKPMYYCRAGSAFLFASEAKVFLEHPEFRPELDREALLEYFTFQNFFTHRTLLRGVTSLAAGCYLTVAVAPDGPRSPDLTRYWDYRFEEPEGGRAEAGYLEELDFLLGQAVTRQLVSDVGVSAYLSGGMDSGAITAIAARSLPHLRTFTCGFDLSSASGVELEFDERAASERMSHMFKTEHYEVVLKGSDMERALPDLVWHLEEPRVGQSYPNFCVARLASRFNKVVLSGTGGDEMFGGYPWRYYRAAEDQDFERYVDSYYLYWQRLIPNSILRRLFQPIWRDVSQVWTRDIFRDTFTRHADRLARPEDYVNHALTLEAKTFLHGLLAVEDKLSMAHSIEARVPFLDNDLVDFAMRLPARFKVAGLDRALTPDAAAPGDRSARFHQKTRDGKILLRRAMERHLPRDVAQREKQGFSAPDASWFRGESLGFVRRVIDSKDAQIWRVLDQDVARSLVAEHVEGRQNRRLLIWSLLYVEAFMTAFTTPRAGARAR